MLPRWKFPGVAYRRTLPAAIVFALVQFSVISAAFPDPPLAFGPFRKILLNLTIPLLTGAGALPGSVGAFEGNRKFYLLATRG